MENLPKNDGYCVVHHRNDDLLAVTRTNFLVHFAYKKKDALRHLFFYINCLPLTEWQKNKVARNLWLRTVGFLDQNLL